MDSSPQIDVSIIIVNWKSRDFVRRCLASVYKFTREPRFEVIVIDNGSFDGCGDMLAAEFPRAVFIQGRENLGFARANNIAARQAKGNALLLLNPDTELQSDSISILLRRLQSLPRAGAVGCRLLNGDGSLQTSCVQPFPTVLNQMLDSRFFQRLFPRWRIWAAEPLRGGGAPAQAQAISGACILVKRSVFEQIAGYSDFYFMYGEDLDLCFKIRRAGFAIYHLPETAITHFGGGSARQHANDFSNVMMRESVYQFFLHNRGRPNALLFRATVTMAALVRMAVLAAALLLPGDRAASLRKWRSIFCWSIGMPATRHARP